MHSRSTRRSPLIRNPDGYPWRRVDPARFRLLIVSALSGVRCSYGRNAALIGLGHRLSHTIGSSARSPYKHTIRHRRKQRKQAEVGSRQARQVGERYLPGPGIASSTADNCRDGSYNSRAHPARRTSHNREQSEDTSGPPTAENGDHRQAGGLRAVRTTGSGLPPRRRSCDARGRWGACRPAADRAGGVCRCRHNRRTFGRRR